MSDNLLNMIDLGTAIKRMAVVLCLDTGEHMRANMKDLNNAITLFYNQIKEGDFVNTCSIEVAVVQFGNGKSPSGVDIVSDFVEVSQASIPTVCSGGLTQMGLGVQQSLDLLDARKKWYQSEGIDYYQPILVLMSSGKHTTPEYLQETSLQIRTMIEYGKLKTITVAFDEDADLSALSMMSGGKSPIYVDKIVSFLDLIAFVDLSIRNPYLSLTKEELEEILAEFTSEDL